MIKKIVLSVVVMIVIFLGIHIATPNPPEAEAYYMPDLICVGECYEEGAGVPEQIRPSYVVLCVHANCY